jgi:hypothetical protein
MLVAMAIAHLRQQSRRPRLWTVAVVALLLVELVPAPRLLSSAAVPHLLDVVANDPRDVRVLNLPFGLRDGLGSRGDYSSEYQYFQTVHEKRLIGGYLSRLPEGAVREYEGIPVLSALLELSEGKALAPERLAALYADAPAIRAGLNVGWVVIDTRRATAMAAAFAQQLFQLQWVASEGPWELYRADL